MDNTSNEDSGGMGRREFMRIVALGAAASALGRGRVMAGPFDRSDFDRSVPADKKLDAEWVKSLFARGSRTVYRGADLDKIGMPVGGLYSGQLYLGGDGKLWLWDIFNQFRNTVDGHYARPLVPSSPVDQSFTLGIADENGAMQTKALDATGFSDVTFCGEYPIGFVEYRDGASPIGVSLEAFSPFAPLDVEESSLPATVMRFTLKNTGTKRLKVELRGHLENGVCLESEKRFNGTRRNRILREEDFTFLECDLQPPRSDLAYPSRTPIVFADTNSAALGDLGMQADWGSMGLALLEPSGEDDATAFHDAAGAEAVLKPASVDHHEESFGQKLMGSLGRKLELDPGQSQTVSFVITWYFPNLKINGVIDGKGRYYATCFDSATAVARYLAANYTRLYAQTTLWHDTWYDSTLPYWLLDRTLTNISTLATSTAYRFADGRFYGWEGVGSCHGTCTHVWQYEQAMGRLFPELDILLRERADFNPQISFRSDGMIDHRGEFHAGEAVDGQTGTILRAYRDHQVSKDDAFLKRNWPSIKKATEWLIHQPGGDRGILTGSQHNTLDAEWYGPVAWLSGMYLASLGAAEQMALEMGDTDFAGQCRSIRNAGATTLAGTLFNGEYFMNKPDPAHAGAINSGTGCEIDQVLGQSWAFQVGLGRILPERETRTALQSLWRYNFSPNVGPYRAVNRPGRWFAMAGESGLLMCTFPRTDWDYEKAKGRGAEWAAGYFNECMNGFEHQVAGHMIWEGMVEQGLAVERAVHDRYHASRRNPWNEVECGDHYARSMASYVVFLAACGFEYHGPKGHIGFAPRMTPENFKAAFTGAEGWGAFSQKIEGGGLNAVLDVKWGRLRLKTIALAAPESIRPVTVRVMVNNRQAQATFTAESSRLLVRLAGEAAIEAGQRIEISIS